MKLLSFVFVPSKELKEAGYAYQILKELRQKTNDETTEDVIVFAVGCEKKDEIKYLMTKLAFHFSDQVASNPTPRNHNIAKWAIWCFGQFALNPEGTKHPDEFYAQICHLCEISTPIKDMLCITCQYDSYLEYQNEPFNP